MAGWKWIVALALVGYAGLTLVMYLAQRSLMYFPDTARKSPADHGLAAAAVETVTSADGERVLLWHVPPQPQRPVVLYFQGNGGGLDLRARRFARLTAEGTGLIALNYRGYGGSTGRPTEGGILHDARAAYDFAAERYGAQSIVLWGESLGTGVAVALAAERPVARVLLQSPYTSTADVAVGAYWFLPVRLLMLDQFRSDQRIDRVKAPVLVIHADRDWVVPYALGERLYEMIVAPKRFVRLAGAGHNDHDQHGALDRVRGFIAGTDLP